MNDLKNIKELLGSMIPGEPVPEDVWETRDGRRVHIKEMTDKHLVNTLLYLKRRYKTLLKATLTDKSQAVKLWREFLPKRVKSKFLQMEAEAMRRGMTDWESRQPIRE
jgi:hypothetical protein